MILIVEDSKLFRQIVRRAIEKKFKIKVIECESIKDFLFFLSRVSVSEISLIIMDLNLPDGNGLSAISSFMEKNNVKELPFVIVSKGVNRAIIPLAVKYGCGGILAKPINADVLVEKIEQLYPGKFIPR